MNCFTVFLLSIIRVGLPGEVDRELSLHREWLFPIEIEEARMDDAVKYINFTKKNYMAYVDNNRVWVVKIR